MDVILGVIADVLFFRFFTGSNRSNSPVMKGFAIGIAVIFSIGFCYLLYLSLK